MLQGGHRHYPVVGVGEVKPRFVRTDLASALQDHAGDDLEAVGDTVLHFLKQDRLFPQQVVLELGGEARIRDVRDGQKHIAVSRVAVVELLGVEDQAARLAPAMPEPTMAMS